MPAGRLGARDWSGVAAGGRRWCGRYGERQMPGWITLPGVAWGCVSAGRAWRPWPCVKAGRIYVGRVGDAEPVSVAAQDLQ